MRETATRIARSPAFFLLLAAFLFPFLSPVSGAASDSPLDRRLTLNLWGAGLNDFAREIKESIGVDILFYRSDLPSDQNTDNVYLLAGDVPLRTVLECLARRYAFRYQVSATGQIRLSRSYGWVGPEPILKFRKLDGIASVNDDDAALRRLLRELIKPLPLLAAPAGSPFSLNIEAVPTPESGRSFRCVMALPPEMADYLDRAILCLAGDPGDIAAETDRRRLSAVASPTPPAWRTVLDKEVRLSGPGEPRALLFEMARQAGVAIILHSPPPRKGFFAAPPDRAISLGEAIRTVSADSGLGRRAVLASGSVCLEPGNEGLEMDESSRELFWGGLAVAGFDVRAAEGGGQALAPRIRREVFPELWRDPVCAVVYCHAVDRIAVIAPLNAVRAVSDFLGGLRR